MSLLQYQSTTDNRYISVYGKNTAYSSSSEWYNEETKGIYLGKFTKVNNTLVPSTTYVENESNASGDALTITGSYQYIGFLANGEAYIGNIQIIWIESATPSVSIDQSDFRLYTISEVRQLTVTKRNAEIASVVWRMSNANLPIRHLLWDQIDLILFQLCKIEVFRLYRAQLSLEKH